MLILGIETSCDETASAVVQDGQKVLSNIISSQIDLHAETGGVVPEVASRQHALNIIPVINKALVAAKVTLNDIDAFAVTKGPGLIGCLLIGTSAASTLGLAMNKPVIPVNHIVGHIYANWLERDNSIKFPIIVLTVSGGHNEIVLMKNHHQFTILGETRDDSAGEAFDKVARLLNLSYPGGPVIAKAALSGDPLRFKLPRAYLEKGSFDFSFSGLKTAVLRIVESNQKKDQQFIYDLSASFQEAVCDVLSSKLMSAASKFSPAEIHLSGGVSANLYLRNRILAKIKNSTPKVTFRSPQNISYCTDNAAMIASAAYFDQQMHPKQFRQWKNIVADAGFWVH